MAWYVWLVGVYHNEVGEGETGVWGVVGVFTSRDKALEAAWPGCFVTVMPLDEAWEVAGDMAVEWVE